MTGVVAPTGGLRPKQSSDWDLHGPHHPHPKYEDKKYITNQPTFGMLKSCFPLGFGLPPSPPPPSPHLPLGPGFQEKPGENSATLKRIIPKWRSIILSCAKRWIFNGSAHPNTQLGRSEWHWDMAVTGGSSTSCGHGSFHGTFGHVHPDSLAFPSPPMILLAFSLSLWMRGLRSGRRLMQA